LAGTRTPGTGTGVGTRGEEGQTGERPSLLAEGTLGGGGGALGTESLSETATTPEGLRITSDMTTNSLVIHATPQEYRTIEQALGKLDIVPLQVLIEATIAEVALRDQLRFGVEWFLRFGDIRSVLTTGDTLQPLPQAPGFSAVLGSGDSQLIINALDSVTDVKIISSPQLLVLDNQIARLQVGDEVPIVSREAQSVLDPEAPIVNEIEYRDTGVILDVRPRVSASGLTVLEIGQEVSRISPTPTEGIRSPTINQRRVTTTVAVHTGETVALGGLIQDQRNLSNAGVPILSRIPVLGALFGSRNDTSERTELLVLLTPRVLSGREDARAVTEDLRRRIHALPEASGQPGAPRP
jgi:general secretion pathway protein D